MPDEFDFKKYKSFDDFGKTIEGSKYLHDLYLKAVNHPIRREILEIINKESRISEEELFRKLKERNILSDLNTLQYNLDYLLKAFCIEMETDEEKEGKTYQITQSGKVIEYLEEK